MRRGFGLFFIGLGTALIVLAPMVKFYAVPLLIQYSVLDQNPDDTSNSSGTVATVIDLATASEKNDVALDSTRRTKSDVTASQQAGNGTCVLDSVSVISLASDSSGKPYLPVSPERYAFNCESNALVVGSGSNVGGVEITQAMIGDDTQMPLKFPFFTQPQTYSVFDTSIMKGAPAEYIDTEDVQGLSTYKFIQKIPDTVIGKQGDADEHYQNETSFYVEPTTGVVVKGASTVKQWLVNPDGSQGLVLLDGTIGFTEEEITASVESAKSNSSKLNLVANVVPIASLVIGFVLLVVGILMARRPSRDGDVPSAPATPTATASA